MDVIAHIKYAELMLKVLESPHFDEESKIDYQHSFLECVVKIENELGIDEEVKGA